MIFCDKVFVHVHLRKNRFAGYFNPEFKNMPDSLHKKDLVSFGAVHISPSPYFSGEGVKICGKTVAITRVRKIGDINYEWPLCLFLLDLCFERGKRKTLKEIDAWPLVKDHIGRSMVKKLSLGSCLPTFNNIFNKVQNGWEKNQNEVQKGQTRTGLTGTTFKFLGLWRLKLTVKNSGLKE